MKRSPKSPQGLKPETRFPSGLITISNLDGGNKKQDIFPTKGLDQKMKKYKSSPNKKA